MDIFDEIIAKIITDTPRNITEQEINDPLRFAKNQRVASPERKDRFPNRQKNLPKCPCKPEDSSDSCADGRYLTRLMTSKDVLFPPEDNESIKPTESEILSRFTSRQIAEFRDAFDYFDLECKGYIQTSYVAAKMRTMGETAILPEMIEMMKDVSAEGDGKVYFPDFLRIMARNKIHNDRCERLREAFEILDHEKTGYVPKYELRCHLMDKEKMIGYIPANELRFTLINLGEILTDEQVDVMIPQLDINDNGMVWYEDIVQLICRKEEEEDEMFEETMSYETDEIFKGRFARDCPPIQIESSSSGFLAEINKFAADQIEKLPKPSVDYFKEEPYEKISKPPVETHDVGV